MQVKVIKQSATLEVSTEEAGFVIEDIARVCYRHKSSKSSDYHEINKQFLRKLIDRGHHSPFEHASATLYITTNRAIANELVRHRHASYMQESTRYVKYDELEFIPDSYQLEEAAEVASGYYRELIEKGIAPQSARDVLPLCTSTRMYMTANLRAWREILVQRLDKAAHPQMQELAKLMLEAVRPVLPVYFEGIGETDDRN